MTRNLIYACLIALSVSGTPAMAQSMQDVIVQQLVDQGFHRIRINTTFLGRVRIVATSDTRSREIIFNPRTGEILRDYWDDLDEEERDSPRIVSPFGGESGSASPAREDDDDDRDDDRDDDDDDDDDRDDDRDDDDDDRDDSDDSDDSGDDDDDGDDD